MMQVSFFALVLAPALALAAPVAAPAQSAPEAPHAMQHMHADAKPSTVLTVRVADHTVTLSVADLEAIPQTTLDVLNGHTKQNERYAGPLVSDVLARAGVTLSDQTQHAILDQYVTATGTDGYFVVFSGAELQFGLHKAQAIVAITRAGKPLTHTGAFQLIDSADIKPARWVRNLDELAVHAVDPAH